ncbi:MAG: SDR family oxidoreductase [Clostridiales bacterium]
MDKKIAIVTGANSGIGTATSIELAKAEYKVIMLCRNQKKGSTALEIVKEKSNSKDVNLALCDLSSFSSINEFCSNFINSNNKLDLLINNAGVILTKRQLNANGIEYQFAVNYLAPFLLSNKLIYLMKKNESARIINVSSGAHSVGKINFDNINFDKGYGAFKAYAQSKLALIMFTYELSRILKETNITVNCLNPGAVGTNIGINRETGSGTLIMKILRVFFKTPEQGAETSIYLATSPELKNTSGLYFSNKKPIKSSKLSYDKELAKKLWQYSESIVF